MNINGGKTFSREIFLNLKIRESVIINKCIYNVYIVYYTLNLKTC